MAGEVIDAANYFPGNPQQKSIQKQPFIIISKRDLVSTVKEEAKNNKIPPTMIELITPDDTSDETYDTAKQEIVNDEKVTVFIKYWKKDGYIYFRKFTSTVVIKEDTNTGFTIYPLADMKWKIRKKSSFGRSETEDLIPNQKAINLLLALQLLSVQLTGFPKVLYKEGAINPSQWTNEIGGFIADRSGLQQGWGAQYMNPGTVTPLAGDLTEKFLDYTKTLSGATETSTGSLDKAGQFNAQAIMLLQQAAGVPIEKIKKRYHQAMEDIGRIWEQFWKVKYNTTRMVQIKDEEGNPTYQPFNGSNYTDIDMQLKIDIGPSTSYSDSLSTATLDKLYDKGAIGTVMYLKYSTKAVAPFKDSLIKEIQQQQEAPPDVNKVLSQLTPQEQQAFMRMTPQQQQAVIQQAGMNNMQSNTVKTA
jgi:hypothetical protein